MEGINLKNNTSDSPIVFLINNLKIIIIMMMQKMNNNSIISRNKVKNIIKF